jgi:glycosyltransferase involved in cell wall biosynthesis
VEAVAAANAAAGGERFRLRLAGGFVSSDEERELRARLARADAARFAEHVGFVSGEAKDRLFRGSDIFLFPTWFANEGQPLNLIEALAYGLPCVTTRWRSIPEYFPPGYPGLCEPKDIPGLARALVAAADATDGRGHRAAFEARYALGPHLRALADALRLADPPTR